MDFKDDGCQDILEELNKMYDKNTASGSTFTLNNTSLNDSEQPFRLNS